MLSAPLQQLATILIVDDIPSSIKTLREAVRDMGEVYFATNGPAAIELARLRVPDVILLDIEMPGMNGYSVCEAIKADPLTCNAAIIFVTSHNSIPHELKALSLGGVDFIQKPINTPVIRARIQTHLSLQIKTRQLIQARRDLTDVVENLPVFIAHWDTKLTNSFCNDTAGKWFDITADAMRGRQLDTIFGEVNFAAMQPHIANVLMLSLIHI